MLSTWVVVMAACLTSHPQHLGSWQLVAGRATPGADADGDSVRCSVICEPLADNGESDGLA